MPNKRVTMQDIADACGLSRNTVSKAFNGRGSVPQATKEMIIKKAVIDFLSDLPGFELEIIKYPFENN